MKPSPAKKHTGKENKKHIFSLYVQNLFYDMVSDTMMYSIKNELLIHRITYVLRLTIGDVIHLFDGTTSITGTIAALEKKSIIVEIQEKNTTKDFEKKIQLYVPVLKKEALEEAIYNATEMGVSEIQLIKTEYSQKTIPEHELLRLQKIIIAACEQSKRFNIPQLKPLISFSEIKKNENEIYIWFDPDGLPLFSLCATLEKTHEKTFSIFIGPESDFSTEEKEILKSICIKYGLTPTILRSKSAVALSVGVIRSIVEKK